MFRSISFKTNNYCMNGVPTLLRGINSKLKYVNCFNRFIRKYIIITKRKTTYLRV